MTEVSQETRIRMRFTCHASPSSPHLTYRLSPSDVALRAGLRPIRRYGGGMRGESEPRDERREGKASEAKEE